MPLGENVLARQTRGRSALVNRSCHGEECGLLVRAGGAVGLLNVELVSFGIDHVDEVLAAHVPGLELASPEGNEALDLGIDPPAALVFGRGGSRASHIEFSDTNLTTADLGLRSTRRSCPVAASNRLRLLLASQADPKAPGPDGRSPFRLAISTGRNDVAQLLRRYGADDDASASDRLVSACMQDSRADALEELASNPELADRMTELLREPVVRAAEEGNTAVVGLMLDLGFPVDEPAGEEGGTVLHAAAYAGSADTVRMLLSRGANIEARDARWVDTALGWAAVGSGERPSRNPSADWLAAVRTLLDAGASTAGITLSADDPKAPSPEVAGLLRSYGVGSAPLVEQPS